jgi:hypothetical protein
MMLSFRVPTRPGEAAPGHIGTDGSVTTLSTMCAHVYHFCEVEGTRAMHCRFAKLGTGQDRDLTFLKNGTVSTSFAVSTGKYIPFQLTWSVHRGASPLPWRQIKWRLLRKLRRYRKSNIETARKRVIAPFNALA